MRVVLDSSVLIAAHVARAGVCAELHEEILQHHELVLSDHILGEVERNLRRKFLLPEDLIRRSLAAMTRAAQMVEPATISLDTARDPNDLPVIGTAVAALADLLVTHQESLLAKESLEGIAMVRPGAFWKWLSHLS